MSLIYYIDTSRFDKPQTKIEAAIWHSITKLRSPAYDSYDACVKHKNDMMSVLVQTSKQLDQCAIINVDSDKIMKEIFDYLESQKWRY